MGAGAKVLTVGLFCARRIFAKTRKSVKFHDIFWILLLLTAHAFEAGETAHALSHRQCGVVESPEGQDMVDSISGWRVKTMKGCDGRWGQSQKVSASRTG
jgi:hypothetical protein